MSGRLSDPLTVVTQDGSSWWKRGVTPEGRGLYAHAGSTERCPVLRTIRELAAFGLRGMSAPEPDGITQAFAPVQALREPEGEFHAFLHHAHTTSHDLPETGGQR